MTKPQQRARLTYEDYRKIPWPENARYELLDGELVLVACPNWFHQQILGNLYYILRGLVQEHDLGRVALPPFDVRLGEDVMRPDLLFIPHENADIVHDAYVLGAPALVVEILSPSTEGRDRGYKLQAYARHGVQEYWIIDPEARSIEVFRTAEEGFQPAARLGPDDTLRTPHLADHPIAVAEIFAD